MVCGQASLAMKTLVINNQKGGVGKTMLAVHAAWFLAETGKRVLVVDLDPQANASYTLANARLAGCSATCSSIRRSPRGPRPASRSWPPTSGFTEWTRS